MSYCLNCGKPVSNKYCNVSCQNKHQNSAKADKKYGELKSFNVECFKCEKIFQVMEREKLFPQKKKYYCSRSCANTRNVSTKTKEKIRNGVKIWYNSNKRKKQIIYDKCKICGSSFIKKRKDQIFCDKICAHKNSITILSKYASIAGRNSAKKQTQLRRSKNEIYFSELCKKRYNNVLTNVSMFDGWDADIILNDFKIAILWNGKWHYEKITKKHSVKQVQNRDKIKIDEIKKMGYEPYIIKDLGKYNKSFVEKEFKKLRNRLEVATSTVS